MQEIEKKTLTMSHNVVWSCQGATKEYTLPKPYLLKSRRKCTAQRLQRKFQHEKCTLEETLEKTGLDQKN